MKKESLDNYDVLPEDMIDYLANYGRHFNHKLLEFAVSKMTYRSSSTGGEEKLTPLRKDTVDNLLTRYGIRLNNNELYDYVYVANMCKADFYKSSIPDEEHMAKFIKDVIDDVDGYDGLVFNRWYADTRRKGIPIDWHEML